MDDGTIARLDDQTYYVTTTSTGADHVEEWLEWWNASWGLDVEVENVTGALAAVNVAGPRARELLARLAVALRSFALADRPFVPVQSEPPQVGDDRLLPARNGPGRVGVVDPQEHPIAERTVCDGAERVPDV
jgi:hypothetical protein